MKPLTGSIVSLLLLTLAMALGLSQPIVYIIAVKECSYSYWGGYTPDQFAGLTRSLLESEARNLGVELTVIEVLSIEDWDRLMKDAPANAIIVNAHTSYVPVPPSYGLDWRSFVEDLATNIVKKGWIWVQPAGYGFYYFYYNFTLTERGWFFNTSTAGDAGLQALTANLGFTLSVPGGSIIPIGATIELTDVGKEVFRALGYDMPDRMSIEGRYPVISDVAPEWYFYAYKGDFTAIACAAFRAGNGAIIWGGLGPGVAGQGDVAERVARATVAMIFYYLYPDALLQRGQAAFGATWRFALIGAVAVAAAVIGAILLKKKR